jgi:hypothetical protein
MKDKGHILGDRGHILGGNDYSPNSTMENNSPSNRMRIESLMRSGKLRM